MITEIKSVVRLCIDIEAREWCKLPYPNHPRGCPNYGKKATCPPGAPLVADYFDLAKPIFLVGVEFDLLAHSTRMLQGHPGWSDRQARCVLYWQPKVNGILKRAADEFCMFLVCSSPVPVGIIYTLCPEAMGVNVIATALDCGIPIQVRPAEKVWKIALVGTGNRAGG